MPGGKQQAGERITAVCDALLKSVGEENNTCEFALDIRREILDAPSPDGEAQAPSPSPNEGT